MNWLQKLRFTSWQDFFCLWFCRRGRSWMAW